MASYFQITANVRRPGESSQVLQPWWDVRAGRDVSQGDHELGPEQARCCPHQGVRGRVRHGRRSKLLREHSKGAGLQSRRGKRIAATARRRVHVCWNAWHDTSRDAHARTHSCTS